MQAKVLDKKTKEAKKNIEIAENMLASGQYTDEQEQQLRKIIENCQEKIKQLGKK